MCQVPLPSTTSWSLLQFIFIKLVMLSSHLTLCCPLLFLPSMFPSIRVFSNESILYIRWPKYWSFSISISPSNEYSRLTSFRIDWLDLLAVQETLKSLLYHYNSKASVLQCSAFFTAQLTSVHDYWKELCLTLCDPWTVAHQAPLSMGFSRQEYWSGLPFIKPRPSLILLKNKHANKMDMWTCLSHVIALQLPEVQTF